MSEAAARTSMSPGNGSSECVGTACALPCPGAVGMAEPAAAYPGKGELALTTLGLPTCGAGLGAGHLSCVGAT